jgi:hypothetical protein
MELGHNNIVAISPTVASSENAVRMINPEDRQCLYENENKDLKIYKNYSQSNCYFECFYYIAKELMKIKYNTTHGCVPWYFPSPDESPLYCNPWVASDFLETMLNIPTEKCKQCLPDCSTTTYKIHVTAVPLRSCRLENSANSQLCNKLQNPTRIVSTLDGEYGFRFQTGTPHRMQYISSKRETGRFKIQVEKYALNLPKLAHSRFVTKETAKKGASIDHWKLR